MKLETAVIALLPHAGIDQVFVRFHRISPAVLVLMRYRQETSFGDIERRQRRRAGFHADPPLESLQRRLRGALMKYRQLVISWRDVSDLERAVATSGRKIRRS